MLDPKIADLVSKELSKESIVVFDEAHNIGMDPLFYYFRPLDRTVYGPISGGEPPLTRFAS